MNKNEEYSRKNYDKLAENYDTSFDGRFTARFKQKLLEFCEVSDGDSVLDVGCGNGRLVHEISLKVAIKAHGIDIAPKMVEVCREKYPDIDFQVTSGEDLPFSDGSLDMVTICWVLHHLNNPVNFFNEAHRVLRPGGMLVVGEPWLPIIVRQLGDWVVSPLLRAGDNNIFSHKRLI
jgi:ubiquinone/menaquinone biosynthesis C-methylase UbiE